MQGKSWDEWIRQYSTSHQNSVNRACHTIGIPMIAISILMIPVAIGSPQCWWWALGLFVARWVFQFIGHAFEGKPPELRLAFLVCRPELVVRQAGREGMREEARMLVYPVELRWAQVDERQLQFEPLTRIRSTPSWSGAGSCTAGISLIPSRTI